MDILNLIGALCFTFIAWKKWGCEAGGIAAFILSNLVIIEAMLNKILGR